MNDSPLHFALREWRRHVTAPKVMISLLGVGLVLGLIGPFDTNEILPFVPRLLYWVAMVFVTYLVAYFIGAGLYQPMQRLPKWPGMIATGVLMGLVISGVVVLVNIITFGFLPQIASLPRLFGTVTAISVVVNVVLELVSDRDTAAPVPQIAPLLDRLPLEKRGALVALSVEDHYTRVFTTKGEELLLMRLSDAIREAGSGPGGQVHRSHWAAFDQVVSARRKGDRAILTMTTGLEVPVSRANIETIKEAGLLPR